MKRRAVLRGYTIVELIMSLSVLAIGAAGVIAMQRVTLASNQHAKNLAVANGIAEAWADALAADASLWNGNDLGDTVWLQNVNNVSTWFRPVWSTGHQFGPGFSPLGDPLVPNNLALARYCTDLRLAWLNNQPGTGLIRAEIRVFWKRENAVTSPLPAALCTDANVPANMSAGGTPEGYHFVFLTTAISQQATGTP